MISCFQVNVLKPVSGMALREYAAQVGGQCRTNGENPGSSHSISIPKRDKAIKSHLRSFGTGFAG